MKTGNSHAAIGNSKEASGFGLALFAMLFALCFSAEAGQAEVYRVGIIFHGGEWDAVVGGLRDGLKELGLEEKKHLTMEVRNTKGDVKAVDEAARSLERDKVNLLFSVATSVTLRARKATVDIPIVFCAGTDPVALDSWTVLRNPVAG
jgi:putative ABC transport system substrate-binding protein